LIYQIKLKNIFYFKMDAILALMEAASFYAAQRNKRYSKQQEQLLIFK